MIKRNLLGFLIFCISMTFLLASASEDYQTYGTRSIHGYMFDLNTDIKTLQNVLIEYMITNGGQVYEQSENQLTLCKIGSFGYIQTIHCFQFSMVGDHPVKVSEQAYEGYPQHGGLQIDIRKKVFETDYNYIKTMVESK